MQLHLESEEDNLALQPKCQPQEETSKRIESKREYHRKWREEHRERCREHSRLDYRRNYARYRAKRGTEEFKARLREYMRQYRLKYPERYLAALRESNRKHKAKRKAYLQKPENQSRRREIEIRRYRTDIQYMLSKRIRARITEAFSRSKAKRNSHLIDLVGCSGEHLIKHIESQFVNGMNWEDKSSYEIDHKVPLSAFLLQDPEEAKWACHWKNLQPLNPRDNLVKHDTIPSPLPDWLPHHIAERINSRRPGCPVASPI